MNKTTAIAAIIVIVVLGLIWGGRGTKKDNRPSPAASPLLTKAALPDEGDMIVLNAADYEKIEGPVKVLDDPSCAGGKCLFVPDKVLGKPVKLTAKAVYRFTVKKAGRYKLWIRHWWQDECGNSLLVSFDGGERMLFGDDGTVNHWRWPPALKMTVELEAGEHVLEIIPREDGLKFDQIILTTDPEYYPVGIMKKPAEE